MDCFEGRAYYWMPRVVRLQGNLVSLPWAKTRWGGVIISGSAVSSDGTEPHLVGTVRRSAGGMEYYTRVRASAKKLMP